ncbi:hypothetical protein LRS13_14420 [Svornostia abyssi]|uniref:Blue (type 1) copper domain-containing protein n=1 Tax=Svornostia abyssi TaxID=2898438 RepID=A0ABY5PB65_9ACTN|nr:hypothetical protein LRS13_14420 [Parviterribacteraceae bacterium J379]
MRRRATIILATALALLAFTSPGAHAATADDPAATAATTRDAGARQKPRTPGQRRRCRRGATRKTSGTRRGGASKAKTKTCAKTKTKKKTKPKAKPKPSSPGTTAPSGDTGTTAPAQDGGSTGTTPSGGSTPGGGGDTSTPELNAVGVKAYDRSGTFVFETTRSTVRPGELTVSFHNYDLDDHNLWFEGTSPLVSPVKLSDPIPLHGDVTTTVTVAAGAYRFFCTVPGHGTMTKALTVQ